MSDSDDKARHGLAPTWAQPWHGTTILLVRKGNEVVLAGDGQVSVGNTIMPLRVIAGLPHRATSRYVRHLACFSWLIGCSPGIYPRATPNDHSPAQRTGRPSNSRRVQSLATTDHQPLTTVHSLVV